MLTGCARTRTCHIALLGVIRRFATDVASGAYLLDRQWAVTPLAEGRAVSHRQSKPLGDARLPRVLVCAGPQRFPEPGRPTVVAAQSQPRLGHLQRKAREPSRLGEPPQRAAGRLLVRRSRPAVSAAGHSSRQQMTNPPPRRMRGVAHETAGRRLLQGPFGRWVPATRATEAQFGRCPSPTHRLPGDLPSMHPRGRPDLRPNGRKGQRHTVLQAPADQGQRCDP
jgi:hypothetical protein